MEEGKNQMKAIDIVKLASHTKRPTTLNSWNFTVTGGFLMIWPWWGVSGSWRISR
jgi:hypothetical protein